HGQRAHDGRLACSLSARRYGVAPPLQADLAEAGLVDGERNPADFCVCRIKRQQMSTLVLRSKQARIVMRPVMFADEGRDVIRVILVHGQRCAPGYRGESTAISAAAMDLPSASSTL